MKGLLGKKVGMSQMFAEDGSRVAVTLISALPNVITLRRDAEKDGRATVQLGLPKEAVNKGEKQQVSKGAKPAALREQFAARREFELEADDDAPLTVAQFAAGDVVEVIGVSKGKGFQGVVKRHGFKGGPASHGHRHVLRKPGSIGSAFPQHVMKGKKMAGRMGADRVTVKNLTVTWIDAEKNLMAVKGAVPGKVGSVVEIRLSAAASE